MKTKEYVVWILAVLLFFGFLIGWIVVWDENDRRHKAFVYSTVEQCADEYETGIEVIGCLQRHGVELR